MALLRPFFYRKPPDGLLEISERVFVFDCCFTTEILDDEEYKVYIEGIFGHLREFIPDASFMVFNFREGENQSLIANILSEYDVTVIDYPRQYENCPVLKVEMIHHFLKSSESWLSLGQNNVLLMHCERGGWPVLAFMLAALLLFQKQYTGEQKTLDMIYKQGPRELLNLISPLDPLPSQFRYLQYISRRNVASDCPPLDRALTLDCIILRVIPNMDGEGGCRPLLRVYGQDPLMPADRTAKVLFSVPKSSKVVWHYKQADCELVKIDVNCHIQGDVVLECITMDSNFEREKMMFRVMFNTAFIRSNILMLNRDEIDILWDVKDQFPKDFRAEVILSEMNSTSLISTVDIPGIDDKKGLPIEAFCKVQEIFSNVDWLYSKPDVARSILHQITASNSFIARLDSMQSKRKEHLDTDSLTEERNENLDSLAIAREEKSDFICPQSAKKEELDIVLPMNAEEGRIIQDLSAKKVEMSEPTASESGTESSTAEIESKELQAVPQRSPEPKVLFQRIIRGSLSNPALYCNSFQASTATLSRYHSAPSLIGITALLHDHSIFENNGLLPMALSPKPAVSSSLPCLSTHAIRISTVQESEPPASKELSSEAVVLPQFNTQPPLQTCPPQQLLPPAPSVPTVCPSASEKLNSFSEPCSVVQAWDRGKSRSIPPPPPLPFSLSKLSNSFSIKKPIPVPPAPPPQSQETAASCLFKKSLSVASPSLPISSSCSGAGSSATVKTTLMPSPPPPPSTSAASASTTRVMSSLQPQKISAAALPPPPPPLHSGFTEIPTASSSSFLGAGSSATVRNKSSTPPPPPPPVPPSSASATRAISSLLVPQSSAVPPSPPPPLGSRLTASPTASCSVPAPPPPPNLVPKEGSTHKTSQNVPPVPPPAAPFSNCMPKTGNASLLPHSSGSNGKAPPAPPLGTKGRLQSRSTPRHQSVSRKSNLKPYHWLKLSRAVQGSLWAEAQKPEEASKAPEFDMSELESLFAATVRNLDNGSTGGKLNRRASGPKFDKVHLTNNEEIRHNNITYLGCSLLVNFLHGEPVIETLLDFIDLRRAYNCEIMLSKVKIPLSDLMNSVLTLDDTDLDIDQVDNLIKFCPTKEEMELLKNYNGERENLGRCERFFLELMKVPRVESKLRVFSFKMQFTSQVSDLRKNLNVINSACEEIRSSVKLKRIMQAILSLGNALNHGTARGSAVGFRLDSLLKLTDTRARNNKMTLMHYLCKVLSEKLPELLDFSEDLLHLEAATKIQLKHQAEEMQAISKGLEKVVQELTASENDSPISEVFCKSLKEFLSFAEAEVWSLASLYSGVGRNADALALYFGEDPARCPFEQVVSTLLNFARMFVRAHSENCKQIELEKKKALKDAGNEKAKLTTSKKDPENETLKVMPEKVPECLIQSM